LFVAISQFVVANGATEPVKAAFRDRPRLVDNAPGFVRMSVLTPRESPDEIWLITYWADEQSYRDWHGSDAYRESHAHMPSGLKLLPGRTRILFFDQFAS
jgi:heme-degrading monooxygenase HmoA